MRKHLNARVGRALATAVTKVAAMFSTSCSAPPPDQRGSVSLSANTPQVGVSRMKGPFTRGAFTALAALVALTLTAVPLQAQTLPAAELSVLSLSSGTLRPTFAAATTEYRATVTYTVSQITVTATAASGITVEYLDASDLTLADAEATTTGFQVDLAVGETVFKVKVTNGTDTETYTVTVERDSARLFGWTPSRDINALEAAGNDDPQGIWSDGTTMWVADDEDDKLYAYTLASGARDTTKDISLDSANADPQGIWSDETTIWVADDGDDKLYAYALSGGTRQDGTGSTTDKEITLATDNGDPAGIWSDGTTIWVANNSDSSLRVFAYTLSGGANDTDKEFVPIWEPVGIWAHGTTMWVVNHLSFTGNLVEAYTIDLNADGTAGPNHGTWDTDKQFTPRSTGGTTPVGIWSDGKGTVWITAPDIPKVESQHMFPFSAGSTTLSALTINDGTSNSTLRPAFASTTTTYRTSVTADVNRVTVQRDSQRRQHGDSGLPGCKRRRAGRCRYQHHGVSGGCGCEGDGDSDPGCGAGWNRVHPRGRCGA